MAAPVASDPDAATTSDADAAAADTPIADVSAPAPLAGELFLIPISHLDTQWRWTVRETVARFLPQTVRQNVEAFAAHPAWCVNFDGAFRYRLLAQTDPAAFAEVRRFADAGRWKIAGATWDALDVNLPDAESFVRHVLYGRRWFRRHVGQDPRELFLPDCFGFGAHVPVLAAHCGLDGFLTSKLRRPDEMRSAFGVPFPVGFWEGADGSRLLAVLDPGGYGEPLAPRPAEDEEVARQVRRHERILGAPLAVRFFGVGDKGGVPETKSLVALDAAAADDGPLATRAVGADEALANVRGRVPADRFSTWRGELLLTVHGTGCYTSQTRLKRWNARNESLGVAAERAAAIASWLGGADGPRYPAARLRDAWRRFLWHQFHDDLTGTSIPAAYRITVQDEALAASTFAAVVRDAVAHVARALDTTAHGVPLVVFNPLPRPRRELVAAQVPWRDGAGVTVVGPDGEAVPAQLEEQRETTLGREALVRFAAELPPMGCAVFDVREERAGADVAIDLDLRALPQALESGRFRLRLDGQGNLAELFDRELDRELLVEPLRLELFADRSPRFPAWEVQWEDIEAGPLAAVGGPAEVRALPGGHAAVALEVRRRLGRSTFVERYRVPAKGTSDRVEIEIRCAWRQRARLLKATFATGAGARAAVYDAGALGVARPRNTPSLYEVPAQAWADLTEEGDAWGIAVLTDRAGGWDHPHKHVLRRTLLRTPFAPRRFPHQTVQDLGAHRFELAIAPHRGDWREANVPEMGQRFRQPPLPFVVAPAPGPLGRRFSFLECEGGELAAWKEHEDGDEWVARLLDATGRGTSPRLRLATAVTACRALDGVEDALPDAPAPARDGATVDATRVAHRPLTLGVRLAPPAQPLAAARAHTLALPLHRRVVSARGEATSGPLDGGLSFPAERWPEALEVGGVSFQLGSAGAHDAQALACNGQRLLLPAGHWDRVRLLVTGASAGAIATEARIDGRAMPLVVPSATAPLAVEEEARRYGVYGFAFWRLRPGRRASGSVGFCVDHAHGPRGELVPYTPLALFTVDLPLADGAVELELPRAENVLVFAATLTSGAGEATAACDETLLS